MVGRFLDPIADKLLVSTLLISYVGLGRLIGWSLIPVILIVCREIFISGLREFLADYQIRMPVTHMSKIKTTAQMLALGFLMVYPSTPQSWMCYEIGLLLLWLSTLLTVWTGGVYMTRAMQQTHKAH
jgi:cardiolipin synthase